MNEPLPGQRPTTTAGELAVPAHHRPPNIIYDEYGRPHYAGLGQPTLQHIVVQLPEQQGMSPQQREFMMYVVMWLVVAVVLCGCVCAVVVLIGGTLIGIIGTITANLPFIGITLVGVILAAGWAATKIRPSKKKG